MFLVSNAALLDIQVSPTGDLAYDHIVVSIIRNGLKKLSLSSSFFTKESFDELTPVVKMLPFSTGDGGVVLLVCSFYPGVENFFYEMLAKWLSPGKKMAFHSFGSWTFSFKSFSDRLFVFFRGSFFLRK